MLKTPETQIPTEELYEKQKSFDILASVNSLRFDIQNFGRILSETMERVYDEELTFVAEGIDRPLYTSFSLKRVDGQLVYFNNGQWQPYMSTLVTGLNTAKKEVVEDPRKAFLAERAAYDLEIGYKMENLAPGERISWYSPFPSKEKELHGAKFIDDCGFRSDREMGFIYSATGEYDGSLTLESHSVDNSDIEAFEAATHSSEGNLISIQAMVGVYDEVLGRKYGDEFSAGRKAGSVPEENAWEVLKANEDLVEWYFGEIETLAQRGNSLNMEHEKRLLTYGFWAAIKKRMDQGVNGIGFSEPSWAYQGAPPIREVISEEVKWATMDLMNKGQQLIGCGGSITADQLASSSPEKVRDAIFGSSSFEKQPWYGKFKKDGKCVNCKEETEVGEKDWCEECISGHCGTK